MPDRDQTGDSERNAPDRSDHSDPGYFPDPLRDQADIPQKEIRNIKQHSAAGFPGGIFILFLGDHKSSL